MLSDKDVVDSLNVARRIQRAFLPSEDYIQKTIPDSFVLFLPKDIVSGDFYWVEQVNDTILFAVGDCTGHGVPGAMMAKLCYQILDQSLKEFGMVIPNHILDKTLDLLSNKINVSNTNIPEGMDVALCALTGYNLQYSGAHNPLWIVRKGELIECRATRQGISKTPYPIPFEKIELNLQHGDIIYIFSDGFQDQFGGENNKKFKPAQFKNSLLEINNLPMNLQKIALENAFNEWKGEREQTDDVCVMGVKI